jgi:hypothetical protein
LVSADQWADEAVRKLLMRCCAGLSAEFNCMALSMKVRK